MNDISNAPQDDQRRLWTVIILALVATTIRLAVEIGSFSQLQGDPDGYRRLAENLLRYGVYGCEQICDAKEGQPSLVPTAFRPPLYPLSLWLIGRGDDVSSVAIATFHLMLGVGTVLLVRLLGCWWGLGRWSLLAAILVTCDPILLHHTTQLMTETLATFLAVAGLVCLTTWDRRQTICRAAFAALVLGLAILCRPAFAVWLVSVVVTCLVLRGDWQTRFARVVTMLLAAFLVLAPWTTRNYLQLGRATFATTHGGSTLLWGNNRSYYQHLRRASWGDLWDIRQIQPTLPEQPVDSSTSPEVYADQLAYARAWKAIQSEPRMFFYASVVRIGHFWRPIPYRGYGSESTVRYLMRYATAVWYLMLYVLAAVGAWSLRGKLLLPSWIWGTLLCASLMMVHLFYWTDMRMRAPCMPFICLLSALGGKQIWVWRRRRN